MLLYCPKCQNMVGKIVETKKEGETIIKNCNRCGCIISFFVKYKAISSIIRRNLGELLKK